MHTRRPRGRRTRPSTGIHHLSTHKHRNHSASLQTKYPMPNHPQYGCDLARVRGHGHKGLVLTSLPSEEDLTKGFGAPPILRGTRLSCNTIPQFIFLGETVFNGPVREEGLDVGFAVSVVTGMDANPLAEEFFDEWFKWDAVFG